MAKRGNHEIDETHEKSELISVQPACDVVSSRHRILGLLVVVMTRTFIPSPGMILKTSMRIAEILADRRKRFPDAKLSRFGAGL